MPVTTEEIFNFLENRGIQEVHLQKMKDEKIDKDVINKMKDEQLAIYLPCHGDRLALLNFLKSPAKNSSVRKQTLLDRLRKKVESKAASKSKSDDSDSDVDGNFNKYETSRKRKLKGNENARKLARRIDVGWIIKDDTGNKQVRTKHGGGTRKIKMHRDATKEDILKEAIKIFFQGGVSQKGSQNDFDLWDFESVPIKDKVTLADMYESSKMGILRVYLAAMPKNLVDAEDLQDTNKPSTSNTTESAAQSANCISDTDTYLPDPNEDQLVQQSLQSSDIVQSGPFPEYLSKVDATPLPNSTSCLKVSEEESLITKPVPSSSDFKGPAGDGNTMGSESTQKESGKESPTNESLEVSDSDTGTPTVSFPKLRRRRLHLNRSSSLSERSTDTQKPLHEMCSSDVVSQCVSSSLPSNPSCTSPESIQSTVQPGHLHSVEPGPSSSSTATAPELIPSSSREQGPIIILHEPSHESEEFFDHELQAVIRQSLESTEPEPSLQGIMTWWMKKTLVKDVLPTEIVVCRGKILQSTLRVVSRKNFDFSHPFNIIYSGEIGNDLGGPKREFLRELMMEVQNTILEGSDANKVFKHSIDLLHKETFQRCGSLVAWSLLHGGPGLPVLDKHVYTLMNGSDIDDVDVNIIADFDVRARLLQIQDASTEDQFKEVINNDWILDHGLAPHNFKMERRDEILKILFKNEIYYRVHSEISQFIDGLDQVGNFGKAIAKAPEALECLFVAAKSSRLTFSGLRKLYDIEYSPAGSNNRRKEDEVIYCFEAMCADCEANIIEVTLNDLLAFWTGAAEVPPLGFDKRLKICFTDSDKYQLPVAHTCGLEIHLWRGYSDPDNFRDDMVTAIRWGGGFYLA